LKDSTWDAYDTAWRLWSRWCEAEGHPVFLFPDDLPKSRETFFAFLVDQRDIRKNAANTLTGKKAAISFRFKYFNFPDPTQWFLIDQFLKGVRKSDGGTAVIRKQYPSAVDTSSKHGAAAASTHAGVPRFGHP